MTPAKAHHDPEEGRAADLIPWFVPPGDAPCFVVATTPALRRLGVRGASVLVVLLPDAVGLLGNEGGDQMIPLGRVAGLRAVVLRLQRCDAPEVRLFLRDPAATLLLRPGSDAPESVAKGLGYAGFVRRLAAWLVANGRQKGIATGWTWGWATVSCLIAAGMAATTIVLFILALLRPEAGTMGLIVQVLMAALAIWLSGVAFRWWTRHWPRRIRDLSDLERGLPQP